MRVILDGFDGSFLPILQSFKAVMPSLRITGIEELGESVNEMASSVENGDAINVSELFARQDERDELLSDESLFLQDDKFDDSDEATAVKFESTIQANDDAKFDGYERAKNRFRAGAKFARNAERYAVSRRRPRGRGDFANRFFERSAKNRGSN